MTSAPECAPSVSTTGTNRRTGPARGACVTSATGLTGSSASAATSVGMVPRTAFSRLRLSLAPAFAGSCPVASGGAVCSAGLQVVSSGATGSVGCPELLPHIRVGVANAAAVCGVVTPMFDACASAGNDAAVAPCEAAPSPVSGPARDAIGRTEGQSSGDDPGGNVVRVAPVVRRIVGVRPSTVNNCWVVVRNVDLIGRCRLDRNELPVLLLPNRNSLLRRRGQLVVRLCSRAQPLHGVHHVRLLREDRIAKPLRPIELDAHHIQDTRCRDECFEAVVPWLLTCRILELVGLQILVLA